MEDSPFLPVTLEPQLRRYRRDTFRLRRMLRVVEDEHLERRERGESGGKGNQRANKARAIRTSLHGDFVAMRNGA